MKQPSRHSSLSTERPAATRSVTPVVPSEALFGNALEVIIDHQGEAYRLRRTRNGKLLLNK